MKIFRNILIVGWAFIVLTVALAFGFPHAMSRVLGPMASYFHLIPAALLILSFVYFTVRLFKAGMRR